MSASQASLDSRERQRQKPRERDRPRDWQPPRSKYSNEEQKRSYGQRNRERERPFHHRRSNSKERRSQERNRHRSGREKQSQRQRAGKVDDLKQERSDFNKHIIYTDLPVRKETEYEFIEGLKSRISTRVGASVVDNARVIKRDRDRVDISVGFNYDSDAINFIESKDLHDIQVLGIKTSSALKLCRSFDYFYQKAKQLKKDREYQQRKHDRRAEQDKKRRERSYSSRSRNSKERSRNQKYRESSSERRKSDKSSSTIIRVFGIPQRYSRSDVAREIANYNDGGYGIDAIEWEQFQSMKHLKLKMSERDAQHFLAYVEDSKKFNQLFPLVFECPQTKYIRAFLKDYQIRLQFDSKIHPINLYKCLTQYGPVLQLVVQNEDEKVFYATMHHKDVVKYIKNLKLDSKGISIGGLKEGQLVYRPIIQLRKLMQDDKRKEKDS